MRSSFGFTTKAMELSNGLVEQKFIFRFSCMIFPVNFFQCRGESDKVKKAEVSSIHTSNTEIAFSHTNLRHLRCDLLEEKVEGNDC